MVTAAKPLPRPGEILIVVDAVSLNYRERWITNGGMGSSWDKALTGDVVALGESVTR
jgi:NADPH:quinone reductase-like Zn-dependent oxidoreductase